MPKAPPAAPVRSPRLRIFLLGAFRLERDSPNRAPPGSTRKHAEQVHLPTRKIESLLAFLVLHPEPHAREELAALLWGDVSDDLAHSSLRRALVLLRQALGADLLLADRTSIQLNPDLPLWADAHAFQSQAESFLHSASPESAINLALYQGDLLADFYDDWIAPRREQFRSLYLNVLLALAQQHRARADYARAIDFANQLLRRDPANEPAHQIVMFCNAMQGKYTQALQQFECCQRALREALDVEPSPETLALVEWIKEQRTANTARGTRITNLPMPLTSFIGREREIPELARLLQTTRLLTLTGTGGSGKTRLAIHLAAQLADQFKDSAWWVELAALRDPALVLQAIAKTFGVRETPQQSLLEAVTRFLQSKQLLMVLDNCEHLLDACAQISETLLTHCPDLHILATSRQALNIPGERAWIVPSLSLPDIRLFSNARLDKEQVDALMPHEAIRLFVERARAVKPDFELAPKNAMAVTHICESLDGIPLAIELAAARVKVLTAAQIAARLDDRFKLLTGGDRRSLWRHQSLRAVMEWSYELLSDGEQTVFRRLAVFAGGSTLEAVESVCAGQGLEQRRILNLLSLLVDKSLVVVGNQQGLESRNYLPETIREYARERLLASGEQTQLQMRHAHYFLSLAEHAYIELWGASQSLWLTRLENEHDNLRAALRWSQVEVERTGGKNEDAADVGIRLAGALMRFWEVHGHFSEGRQWLERALRAGAGVPARERANALYGAGNLARQQGDYARAVELHEQSIALWQQLGDKQGVARSLDILGEIARNKGDYPRAVALHEESLALRRQIGDSSGIADTLSRLGRVAIEEGDYWHATAHYEESLRIWRETGDELGMALAINNLGLVAYRQSDLAHALTLHTESLALYRELGDKRGMAYALHHLGNVLKSQSEYDRAAQHYEESLSLKKELGDKQGIAYSLAGLADVARAEGDLKSARAWYVESLEIRRRLGEKRGVVESLEGLAGLMVLQGQVTRGTRLLGAAHGLREQIGAPLPAAERARLDHETAGLRAELGEAEFERLWAEGQRLWWEQAVEYAAQA